MNNGTTDVRSLGAPNQAASKSPAHSRAEKVRNPVSPKKLLLTKWTAVQPHSKEKHFLVAKVITPEAPETQLVWIDLEAVFSRSTRRIDWRDLRNPDLWRQGWV